MSSFPEDQSDTTRILSPGMRVFGRYTLEQIVGRGGMGVVWRAHDDLLGDTVALKLLVEQIANDPEAISDLKVETRQCRVLTHPNIVRVHDFVQDSRSAAIAMEFVDGQSLGQRKVQAPGRCLGAEELGPIAKQLCSALSYAHEQARIVHRDLKPANLLLTKEGVLKISDFGISASLNETQTRATGRSSASGTLVYMSPQQLMGHKSTPADDIYALGATLYELLTGKPPFFSGNIIEQVRSVAPRPLAAHRKEIGNAGPPIPRKWSDTILACLDKNPTLRPQSAREVAHLLGLQESIGRAIESPLPAIESPAGRALSGLRALGTLWRRLTATRAVRMPAAAPSASGPASLPNRESAAEPCSAPTFRSRTAAVPTLPVPRTAGSSEKSPKGADEDFKIPNQGARTVPELHDATESFTLNPNATIRRFPVHELDDAPPTVIFDAKKLSAEKAFADAGVSLQRAEISRAIADYHRAAGGGHARAQQQLDWWATLQTHPCLSDVNRDDHLLEQMIENHAQMIFDEARDCEKGRGRLQNLAKAIKLYDHAAELGQPEALTRLGLLHLHGLGVEKNFVRAAALFTQAAEQEHSPALLHLGRLHERGKGVRLNLKKAERFYERAAQTGDEVAHEKLESLRGREHGSPPAPTPEPFSAGPKPPPPVPDPKTAADNKVFVSYCRKDADRVMPLVDALKKMGFNLWIDVGGVDGQGGMEAGKDWAAAIYGQIRRSKLLLCMTTRSSIKSEWVTTELMIGRQLPRAMIPVMLDQIGEDEMPDAVGIIFIRLHCLFLLDEQPFETKLKLLDLNLRNHGVVPASVPS